MTELMQETDFSKILDVQGVDGYLRLGLEFEVLDADLPDGINESKLLESMQSVLSSQKPLGMLQSTVMLTEKGVMHLTLIDNFYLLILAGYRESVNVAKLIAIVDEIKKQVK